MSLLVSCAWDHARLGTATINWTDASGAHAVSVTTGRYSHPFAEDLWRVDVSGAQVVTNVLHFAPVLQAAMDAATAQTVTVTRSTTTGAYTMSCTGGTFNITWTGAAGILMRQLLGFTGNKTGAGPWTSDCTPRYLIVPRVAGRTAYTGPRKVTDIVRRARTDAGDVVAVGPTYLPHVARWEHHFEAEEHVFLGRADADTVVGGHQYTWDSLDEDAYSRGELVMIEDSASPSDSFGFKMLSGATEENKARRVRGEMQKWVIPIEAGIIGTLT